MKHLHKYNTKAAHDAVYNGSDYQEPWVAYIEDDEMVTYNKPHDYSKDYLTFKALDSGTFKFSGNSVSYSTDLGETWTTLESGTDSPTVEKDKYIMWKGELSPTSKGIGTFSSTRNYEAMGNPYSLLYGDNFATVTSLSGKNYALYGLFSGSTGLTSAENLSLPVTTLADYCYLSMFRGCTSLTTAPELPSTTLARYCYSSMFAGCTSLTTAPELPATTLAQSCYGNMFDGCTLLTAAPELPATTLTYFCYAQMFKDCTSLTTAPSALPATTLVNSCYRIMFSGCTSLTTAPELPATTLAEYCYDNMFYGCASLNYIKAIFTTTPSASYTSNWVSGVASTGTFVKNSAATWDVTGVSGIPEGWTVQTASA